MPKRVQIAADAELHNDAGEIRSFEFGEKCREKRMIDEAHDLPLYLRSLRLLLQHENVVVHHLHRVEAVVVRRASEAAEVEVADVATADLPQEIEITEREVRFQADRLERGVR